MKNLFILAIFLFISGCGTTASFHNNPLNGIQVEHNDGFYVSKLKNNICSKKDYGVGNAENDCITGTKHSVLTESGTGTHPGTSVEYGFKFLLKTPKNWSYKGRYIPEIGNFTTDHRFFNDSQLEIAGWQRTGVAKAFNLIFKYNPNFGFHVLDKICATKEGLQKSAP